MDVVPVVAKEIVARLQKQSNAGSHVVCTTELAAILVRVWLFGSEHTDAMGNVGETVEQIETLVDDLVDFLLKCNTPCLSCLQLQSDSYTLKSDLLSQKRADMVKKEALMMYLNKKVLRHTQNSTVDEVLGDIILVILHRYDLLSDVDDATTLLIRRDTIAALSLVLPRRNVVAFMKQDSVEKRRQLEEIARVVWGIRLFNKEEGKDGGAGLQNIHELLEGPLARLDEESTAALKRIANRVTRLLAVIEYPTNALPAAEQRLLQEEYHHLQQLRHHFLTVRCLHRTLAGTIHEDLFRRYEDAFEGLRGQFAAKPGSGVTSASDNLVGSGQGSPAVPKRVVYPLFMALADCYAAAQRVLAEVEEAARLLDLALRSENAYPSSLPALLAEEAMQHIAQEEDAEEGGQGGGEGEEAKAKEEGSSLMQAGDDLTTGVSQLLDDHASALEATGLRLRYATALPETFDAVVRTHHPASLCALRGYCPVRFVQTGLLREGRLRGRAPGLLVVEGGHGPWALSKPQYFAFHGTSALRAFAVDPLRYLRVALRGEGSSYRAEPAVLLLAGLLDLTPRELYVAGARTIDTAPRESTKKERVDASTQTGQIDPYFDHNYRWNEWDLRRQALKLVNLLNMRTHTTQTAASYFRRDNATQARPPKESGTQTMQDAATQPPHVVQYIAGLRGTPSSEIKQVQRVIQY